MTVTGPFAETINNKNPGAGSYEPIKKYTKTAYSIKGKIKQPISEAEKVPGPGRCNYFVRKTNKTTFSQKKGRIWFQNSKTRKPVDLIQVLRDLK